jgi:formyl-CoA transferase
MGAEVVKVEPPGRGDPGRSIGSTDLNSPYFVNWNSNKRSVVLDLDSAEGRGLLLSMLPLYDVFVENYGPGVVERLDLDYDVMKAIHPSLIYARVKGFGTSGPYAHYKCMDSVAQAASGILSATGERDGPPVRPGATIGDSGTGVQLALAILAAYIQRSRTGEGQLIELSMQEALTYYMRSTIANGSDWGRRAVPRSGSGVGAMLNLYPGRTERLRLHDGDQHANVDLAVQGDGPPRIAGGRALLARSEAPPEPGGALRRDRQVDAPTHEV